jgi:hypothetical protein
MKTNTIKKTFVITALMLFVGVTGCNKDYLKENSTNVTTDFLYTTADGLQAAVNGLHTVERAQVAESETGNFALVQGDGGTDIDQDRGSVPDVAHYRLVDFSTQAVMESWWKKWYRIIERCNSIITFGEKADIEPAIKMKVLRDAYLYRGYAYFWLVRKYDNIWLNLLPTTSDNIAGRSFSPAPQSEVYKQIVSDLDKSISYYGSDWTVSPGIFNLGVAKLLRADAAMWMKDYAEAAKQTADIVEKGPFVLVSPENVFTKDNEDNTTESMYVLQIDQFAPGGGSMHYMGNIFTSGNRTVPGMVATSDYGGYGWNRIFPNTYMMSLYDQKYDKRYNAYWQNYYTYNNKDYDFSKVPYKFGDTLKRNQNTGLIGVDYWNKAGIGCKKYFDWIRLPTTSGSYTNIVMFRYPQVLLIASEANMRLGDQTKALSYINMIQKSRILSTSPHQLFTTVTENNLLDEYARELAFEGQRWFILKRFGKLVERVKLYGGASEFRGEPAPDPDYFAARTRIQDYHVRWPIPQPEIDAMGSYPQNPGY